MVYGRVGAINFFGPALMKHKRFASQLLRPLALALALAFALALTRGKKNILNALVSPAAELN